MGLVKTRRLAAMHKQQRAKAKMQVQKKSVAAKPRDPRSAAWSITGHIFMEVQGIVATSQTKGLESCVSSESWKTVRISAS